MLRKIETAIDESRVETGPVQFNEDWPGVFIRGDRAMYYSMMLNAYIAGDRSSEIVILNLVELLKSCRM